MNSWDEGKNKEKAAYTAIKKLSKKIAALAAPIAIWGDGNCGGVIEILEMELEAAGLMSKAVSGLPGSGTGSKRKKISGQKRTAVFERDAYRCVSCGTYKNLTIDHIKPVSAGGGNEESNLQTLCMSCNSKKGAKQ